MLRIGLIGYTNLCSGLGLFNWDWLHAFGDSILSVGSGKGPQQVWTDRQLSTQRPPHVNQIENYFETYQPDVLLFMETVFNGKLYGIAKRRGIKVVGIPMHETRTIVAPWPDLVICTCETAWHKTGGNKALLFLPIGLDLFPFKLRTGHTFVMSLGYDGMRDRRQAAVTIRAFCSFDDPDMRMIVNSQTNFPGRIDDPRIEYRLQNYPEPKDPYKDGDIFLAPIAYGGYERTILEAMSCGMPTLTTDADPMNLFQHDKDFLIQPYKKYEFSQAYVSDTVYNEVSFEAMRDKIEWLLKIPTGKYSERARAQAVAQSWESGYYKDVWLDALRGDDNLQ